MKFKLITLFIILCLGFTSCSENETPEPRTTRTILVYMMANNSLNSFASKNIESMIEGATSKNLNGGNLIVYYAPAGFAPGTSPDKRRKRCCQENPSEGL
ncbi:MAG: clostripain-related cysteine peptidase [Parabacteroides merdae]